jgi:hypothetical protein
MAILHTCDQQCDKLGVIGENPLPPDLASSDVAKRKSKKVQCKNFRRQKNKKKQNTNNNKIPKLELKTQSQKHKILTDIARSSASFVEITLLSPPSTNRTVLASISVFMRGNFAGLTVHRVRIAVLMANG